MPCVTQISPGLACPGPQPATPHGQAQPFPLLVVDDDKSLRELLALYFEAQGFQVRTAGTVLEAWPRVEAGDFELLILDWRLEGADGLDLLNLSKAKHPELPVLIFSGADDFEKLLAQAFAGRADAVVRKGGSLRALADEVAAHLGHPRSGLATAAPG
jgi:DNA-binding response OmpR family regulator